MATFDLESKDVAEAIRGLKRADPEEAADDSFRESTKAIVRDARGNMTSRRGGGTYPRRSGMITEDRNGVKINVGGSYPWARGAEFGSRTSMVFGRRVSNASLSRPHFAPWSGQSFSISGKVGYLVGEALRDNVEEMAEDAIEAVADEYLAELKKSGVKTRG